MLAFESIPLTLKSVTLCPYAVSDCWGCLAEELVRCVLLPWAARNLSLSCELFLSHCRDFRFHWYPGTIWIMGLLLANVCCVPAPAGTTVPLEGTLQALVISNSSVLLSAVQVGHQQLGNPARPSWKWWAVLAPWWRWQTHLSPWRAESLEWEPAARVSPGSHRNWLLWSLGHTGLGLCLLGSSDGEEKWGEKGTF